MRNKEYENKSVEGRDINLDFGSSSSLCRKGRGSHPVLGSGLKQRGQRENVGTGFKPVFMQFRSRINPFANKYLLDPNIFLGGR